MHPAATHNKNSAQKLKRSPCRVLFSAICYGWWSANTAHNRAKVAARPIFFQCDWINGGSDSPAPNVREINRFGPPSVPCLFFVVVFWRTHFPSLFGLPLQKKYKKKSCRRWRKKKLLCFFSGGQKNSSAKFQKIWVFFLFFILLFLLKSLVQSAFSPTPHSVIKI